MISDEEKERINKGIDKAKQGLPDIEADLALQAEATLANQQEKQ